MKRTMTNYEEVYYKFMPAFRSHVAKRMVRELDMTQQEAAKLLGTTQAAINGYLTERIAGNSKRITQKIDEKEIKLFIENIMRGKGHAAQKSVCKVCQTHKRFDCEIMVK